MAKNEILKSIKSKLKHYYCSFKDNNVLTISVGKNSLPHALVIFEMDNYVLHIAVDYPDVIGTAELVLDLIYVVPISLGEPFYYDNNGDFYTGEDALERASLELDSNLLLQLQPPNDKVN